MIVATAIIKKKISPLQIWVIFIAYFITYNQTTHADIFSYMRKKMM